MIVGFGENSVDVVYRLPRYPQPGTAGSKVRIADRCVRPGGQVATTLATCAALGLPTRYLGAFGNDASAATIRTALQQREVDTSLALHRDAPNRYAVIVIDSSHGERVVLWDRDAALAIGPEEVRLDWIAGATHLHVDGTDAAAALALTLAARDAGIDVTCDIDEVTPATTELLEAVTLPILAEHIPAAMTGLTDPERALRAMRRTPSRRLVVTMGQGGAAMLDGDDYIHVPAFAVDVVDSTGAGDVFRGAFIYALRRGDDGRGMLRFANAAAAVACTRAGALDGVPSLADVEARLHAGP